MHQSIGWQNSRAAIQRRAIFDSAITMEHCWGQVFQLHIRVLPPGCHITDADAIKEVEQRLWVS